MALGFDEQYAQKIFTIFQRLHSRESYEGTGIGLAITKKIIEKHNGLIYAESKNDNGATFIIILPVVQASSEAAKHPRTGRTGKAELKIYQKGFETF